LIQSEAGFCLSTKRILIPDIYHGLHHLGLLG
jgi:hypothetical protein